MVPWTPLSSWTFWRLGVRGQKRWPRSRCHPPFAVTSSCFSAIVTLCAIACLTLMEPRHTLLAFSAPINPFFLLFKCPVFLHLLLVADTDARPGTCWIFDVTKCDLNWGQCHNCGSSAVLCEVRWSCSYDTFLVSNPTNLYAYNIWRPFKIKYSKFSAKSHSGSLGKCAPWPSVTGIGSLVLQPFTCWSNGIFDHITVDSSRFSCGTQTTGKKKKKKRRFLWKLNK